MIVARVVILTAYSLPQVLAEVNRAQHRSQPGLAMRRALRFVGHKFACPDDMAKKIGAVVVGLLDARLRCDASDCAAKEIDLRLEDNARLFRSLGVRTWHCPVCGGSATLEWVQLAQNAQSQQVAIPSC